MRFAYFPCGSAVVSFEILLTEGRPVCTSLIAGKGPSVDSPVTATFLLMRRLGCFFLAISSRSLCRELERVKEESPGIARLFTGYSECFKAQLHQSVACNAAHTMEQRAATWLRHVMNRTDAQEIALTQ